MIEGHVDEAGACADGAPPLDQDPLAELVGPQGEDERREERSQVDLGAGGVRGGDVGGRRRRGRRDDR